MQAFVDTQSPAAATLPQWLILQAQRQAKGIALRHKRLGIWQQRSWSQVADEVHRLATALQQHGFAPGSTLAILSRPRPEALMAALAAQWLGGMAALFDPLDTSAAQMELVREAHPEAVFAEGLQELERLQAARLAPSLMLYADSRGVKIPEPRQSQVIAYAGLAAQEPAAQLLPLAAAERTAFAFLRHAADGRIEQQRISHAELLQEGRRLLAAERLNPVEEALAARAFAAAGQARYLLAPWLITGFRLNFPENLGTRDIDRRELGPTLVAGTAETYGRLYDLVQDRLPHPGGWQRRLVDWALATRPGVLQRVLSEWLVRRPLRDVLGFSRVRVPLLVGDPLPHHVQAFFAALDIDVRAWPDPAHWRSAPASSPARQVSGWLDRGTQTV